MKSKDFVQMNVRIAPDVKERLAERAQANFRSLNAEIEKVLSESLAAKKEKAPNA